MAMGRRLDATPRRRSAALLIALALLVLLATLCAPTRAIRTDSDAETELAAQADALVETEAETGGRRAGFLSAKLSLSGSFGLKMPSLKLPSLPRLSLPGSTPKPVYQPPPRPVKARPQRPRTVAPKPKQKPKPNVPTSINGRPVVQKWGTWHCCRICPDSANLPDLDQAFGRMPDESENSVVSTRNPPGSPGDLAQARTPNINQQIVNSQAPPNMNNIINPTAAAMIELQESLEAFDRERREALRQAEVAEFLDEDLRELEKRFAAPDSVLLEVDRDDESEGENGASNGAENSDSRKKRRVVVPPPEHPGASTDTARWGCCNICPNMRTPFLSSAAEFSFLEKGTTPANPLDTTDMKYSTYPPSIPTPPLGVSLPPCCNFCRERYFPSNPYLSVLTSAVGSFLQEQEQEQERDEAAEAELENETKNKLRQRRAGFLSISVSTSGGGGGGGGGFLGGIVQKAKSFVSGVATKVGSVVKKVGSAVKNVVSTVGNWVNKGVNFVKGVVNGVKRVVGGFFNGIKFSGVVRAAVQHAPVDTRQGSWGLPDMWNGVLRAVRRVLHPRPKPPSPMEKVLINEPDPKLMVQEMKPPVPKVIKLKPAPPPPADMCCHRCPRMSTELDHRNAFYWERPSTLDPENGFEM